MWPFNALINTAVDAKMVDREKEVKEQFDAALEAALGDIKLLSDNADTGSSLPGNWTSVNTNQAQPKYNEFLKEFHEWVYANVTAIAEAVSHIELKLMRYQADKDEVTEVYEHPILELINRPNPVMTKRDFIYIISSLLLLAGEAPIRLRRTNNTANTPPFELWPLRPADITLEVGTDQNGFELLTGYIYRSIDAKGKQLKLPLQPWELLFIHNPNPRNHWRGVGVVEAAARTIDILDFSETWNLQFFKNSAIPAALLYTEQKMNKDTMERIRANWNAEYRGYKNTYKLAILEQGLKFQEMQSSIKDMDFMQQQVFLRDKLMAMFKTTKVVLGITDDVNRCYSEDTEVLTENGFKHYWEVGESDRIATINPLTDKIEYHLPEKSFVYDYDGEMVSIETQNNSIIVTPNHKLWRRTDKGEYELIEASELENTAFFKATYDYEGKELEEVVLPATEKVLGSNNLTKNEAIKVPADTFIEYLGYFLSEGGLLKETSPNFRYLHTISQKDEESVTTIRSCINKTGFSTSEYKIESDGVTRWNVYGKTVNSWFRQNCGDGANDKRIPTEFKQVSKRQLRILFDALMLGDGSWDKRDNRTSGYYATTSSQLADDVQEIALKLGYSASKAISYSANGNRSTCYSVHVCERAEHKIRDAKTTINYSGKVWCFEVPNHIFIVRHDGKISAHGNSNAEASEYVFTKYTVKPKMKQLVDHLNEWLLPLYDATGELFFDYEDPLPEDRVSKVTEWSTLVDKVYTKNEIRRELGLPDLDGGDEIWQAVNLAPMTGAIPDKPITPGTNEPSTTPPEPGDETEDGDVQEEALRLVSGQPFRVLKVKPENHLWKKKYYEPVIALRNRNIELKRARRHFQQALKQVMHTIEVKKQDIPKPEPRYKIFGTLETNQLFLHYYLVLHTTTENKVLQFIRETVYQAELATIIANLKGRQHKFFVAHPFSAAQKSADDYMYKKSEYVKISQDELVALLKELIQAQGGDALALLNSDKPYQLLDAARKYLKRDVAKAVKTFNDTTYQTVRDSLAEGITAGESEAELIKRLRDTYEKLSQTQAQVVARTEVSRAANFANVDAYTQSGVVEAKEWAVADDPCPLCEPLDGKVIGLEADYFKNGDTVTGADGSTLTLTYDDVGEPPLHPRCRCTTLPVLISEGKGPIAKPETAEDKITRLEQAVMALDPHDSQTRAALIKEIEETLQGPA